MYQQRISRANTGGATHERFFQSIDRSPGKSDQILRPVRPPLSGALFDDLTLQELCQECCDRLKRKRGMASRPAKPKV